MKHAGKSTIQDLARHLGLDKSSVSLALRGSSQISEKTRRRVLEAAREHGYRPNLAARLLASNSPQVVGLVLPDDFRTLHHEVVVASIRNLARAAADGGVIFVIFSSDEVVQAARRDNATLEPDGLLVWGDVPAHAMALMQTMNRPMVVLDPNDLSYASYGGPTVEVDNAGGGAELVEHLLAQGVQRLLFVQVDRHHLGHQQRWHGARQAWLAVHSLEGLSFCYQDELSDSLLRLFVASGDAAILCSNDMGALGVWHRLMQQGLAVPDDVLLAGFDGDRVGDLIGLTSAVFDCQMLAQKGFSLLMSLLGGDRESDFEKAVLPVTVLPGRTTRRDGHGREDDTD